MDEYKCGQTIGANRYIAKPAAVRYIVINLSGNVTFCKKLIQFVITFSELYIVVKYKTGSDKKNYDNLQNPQNSSCPPTLAPGPLHTEN